MIQETTHTVLVTGALGNIGKSLLPLLAKNGHGVRALELATKKNLNAARNLPYPIDIIWGDIRDHELIRCALDGCSAVIHLAFLLPPESEHPHGRQVNLDASVELINAFKKSTPRGKFLFASSYAVHGDTEHQNSLLSPISRTVPWNEYNRHKIEVEEHLKHSGLTYSIFRLGVVMSEKMVLEGSINPLMFDLRPTAHQEFIHADDAALAIANCFKTDRAWNKIHMLGGGPSCQLIYRDLINGPMEALGIGRLPDEAFSPVTLQGGGWMDTSESQKILAYQTRDFNDFCQKLRQKNRHLRIIIKLAGPLIRRYILTRSPYYPKK